MQNNLRRIATLEQNPNYCQTDDSMMATHAAETDVNTDDLHQGARPAESIESEPKVERPQIERIGSITRL